MKRSKPLRRTGFKRKPSDPTKRSVEHWKKNRRGGLWAELTDEQRDRLRGRSKMRCEAVRDGRRCNQAAGPPHHRITKARGGRLLDAWGETAHLAMMCALCHRLAHDGRPVLISFDMEPAILAGYVTTRIGGKPLVTGADHPYLSETYGEENDNRRSV